MMLRQCSPGWSIAELPDVTMTQETELASSLLSLMPSTNMSASKSITGGGRGGGVMWARCVKNVSKGVKNPQLILNQL